MALKVGIQLYSVRNALKSDPYGTLAKVAEAGYKYIEAANHDALSDPGVGFGVSASKMRATLERLGMSIIGCQVYPLEPERLSAILDYHGEVGNKHIGYDLGFYPYNDLDHILRQCELFNSLGEMCKERGIRFHYHNHYQEFQRFGDKTVYELIMENTDPSSVFIELDTYWAYRGGQDPIDLIRKYKDRIVLLHQKDFPKDAPQSLVMSDGVVDFGKDITLEEFSSTKDPLCFTEIGTGILPIQDIIDAAQTVPNLEFIVLEQDHTQLDEIESIKVSMQAFRKFSGVEWE